MSEDPKVVAAKRIQDLLKESLTKVEDAMALADEHGLDFSYEPDHIGHYYGKGSTEQSDEPQGEGEWYPSSWSSSSIYC